MGVGEDAVSEEEDVGIVGTWRAGDEGGEQRRDRQTLGLGPDTRNKKDN